MRSVCQPPNVREHADCNADQAHRQSPSPARLQERFQPGISRRARVPVLRRKNGELEVAEKLMRAAAETRAARLGLDHPETRSTREQLRLVRDDSSQ